MLRLPTTSRAAILEVKSLAHKVTHCHMTSPG